MISFADDIKSVVTMRDVCGAYGIEVNRQSNAICPFHNDRHASMHIYDGDRGYHCFACGSGGDVITFIQRYFSLNFSDACAKLNNDFAIGLPLGRELSLRELRDAEKAARDRKAKQEAEASEYQRLLDAYHAAMDEYARLDRQRAENAPSIIGSINEPYAQAVIVMPLIEYRLNNAETRLYEHEHKRP